MGYTRKRTGATGTPRYTAYFLVGRGRTCSAGTYPSKKAAVAAWRHAETLLATTNQQDPRAGGRWTPSRWLDVVGAAAAGVLDETRWSELKRAIPPNGKEANVELAKDLASLSVDGGLLIVGVKDEHGMAGEVVGTTVEGLANRID